MKLSPRRQRTADLNKAVETLVRAHGGLPIRINNQPRIDAKTGKAYFPKGAPIGCSDWVAIMPSGMTLFIEVKVSPDEMRASQFAFQEELLKRGHVYILVLDTMDALIEAIEILEEIIRKRELNEKLELAMGQDAGRQRANRKEAAM